MSPLYTYNGKLLKSGESLASNQNCCCSQSGLCCTCPSYYMEPSLPESNYAPFGPEPDAGSLSNANQFDSWDNEAEQIANWIKEHGYECVQNYNSTINVSYMDKLCDPNPPDPADPLFQFFTQENGQWCIDQWLVMVHLASVSFRCCGNLDCEQTHTWTQQTPEFGPGSVVGGTWTSNAGGALTICECVPDDNARICVDGLTKQNCEAQCGIFKPNQVCTNEINICGSGNPLP